MNFYERHIGDYIKNTAHLSLLEHGVYARLLDVYYTQEAPIPESKAARLIGARTEPETEALQVVLQEFFELRDGHWHQARADEEIAAYAAGEPEREVKKANEDNRLKRHREERAKLFKVLTDRGEHAPWNIGIQELRERVSALQDETPDTHAETQPATAPATPATATHYPLPTTQTPEERNTDTSPGQGLPDCPTQNIVDLYHRHLPELPAVRLMTDKRRAALRSFWRWVLTSKKSDGARRAHTADQALTWIGDYFARVRNNDWLMGVGTRSPGHENWRADLDFLLTDKGKTHVIEKTKETA